MTSLLHMYRADLNRDMGTLHKCNHIWTEKKTHEDCSSKETFWLEDCAKCNSVRIDLILIRFIYPGRMWLPSAGRILNNFITFSNEKTRSKKISEVIRNG